MPRLFVLIVVALAVAAPGVAFADAPVDPSGSNGAAVSPTTIDNSFLDTQRDLSECLNNSVELPGCGRAPTQEGDRGGGLQLATFGILTIGMAFIFWRVAKSVRARDVSLANTALANTALANTALADVHDER